MPPEESDKKKFSKWFELARSKGLVQVSRGTKAGIQVLTSDGDWVPYEELSTRNGWKISELISAS